MISHPKEGPRFLALVGPTASGKTSLSLALAEGLDVEIISMDSRQIYRGMDVGTGKVTLRERARVPHHGLDIRDPGEAYSAGQFARDCRGWIQGIEDRGKVPLLVGGTGFFLRSLTHPLFSEPTLDKIRLGALRDHLNGLPLSELLRWAQAMEPGRWEGESLEGGRHRLTRALEIALLTGRSLSWWHSQGPPAEEPLPGVVMVLEHPREVLYERINKRVRAMVEEEGLVEEVMGLLEAGCSPEDPGMTGAGYREAVAHLRGSLPLDRMIEEIQKAHRRYARRQITWFRHQLPPDAWVLDATRPQEELVERVMVLWHELRGEVRSREDEGLWDPESEEGKGRNG
jgi:tRNA dimethylallyltransferase